ncbi:MAG TPA: hypothetical protein VEY33_06770 [Gemmatimonadota bacterium]|nr:hypothetical protein [Gemmatimonadota bacterium]
MTAIEDVEFADALKDRVKTRFAGEPANVLSLEDLLQNKRTAGRLQDLADIEGLEKVVKNKGKKQSQRVETGRREWLAPASHTTAALDRTYTLQSSA